MSQGNKGKGGTVMLSNSPFAQPGAPQPGAQPPGPPAGPSPDPGAAPGGYGAPPGGYGAPPGGPYGGAPQGAPPASPYGAPQGGPPGSPYGAPPGGQGYGAPPDAGGGGWGAQQQPPQQQPDGGGGGWGAPPAPAGMAAPPPGGAGYGAPGMPGPGGPMAAAGGGVPDFVQGQKTKLLGLDQNLASALGYFIGLLSLLYIFMEPKEHRFVRFYAFQWVGCWVLGMVLSVVVSIPAIIAALDSKLTELAIVSGVLSLLFLPFGIMYLIAAFKAFQGKVWKMPVIGGIAEKMAMK